MHTKYQKAEEHSDSHEGDGRRGSEELPVVDAEVPHHRQYHHKHRHHQATGADGHTGSSESSGDPGTGSGPRLSPLLWSGLVQRRGDVAVDHAVVCDVQGQQSLLGVLQQLALVDKFYLMLTTGEVFTGKGQKREREDVLKGIVQHFGECACLLYCRDQLPSCLYNKPQQLG